MAKVTLSRLFEVSKYLTTDSGKELKDALVYISEFVEVVTRNLRNGLTFADNFDTTVKEVSIRPDTQEIVLTGERRRVREVAIRRVIDDTYWIVTEFGWKYNATGDVTIFVSLLDPDGNAAPSTSNVKLALLIHFG